MNYNFPNQINYYKGKVRDVYTFKDKLVMITSDRISAFDHILPKPIPYKGQVLNSIASYFLNDSRDIVPNWLESTPHPNIMIGKPCRPIMIEMVIRGYLVGHAWRIYKSGERSICGINMPDGMKENQAFDNPIITPAVKAVEGHDVDISREELIGKNHISEADYQILEDYTRSLFKRGTELASQKGLILVDTKYEFGYYNNEIILMDEIHTPDSSRYFYSDGYEEKLNNGQEQTQLSKEFVREWLMEQGFQGLEGQLMPEMPDLIVNQITERYIELHDAITGVKFVKHDTDSKEMQDAVIGSL